MAVRSRFRAGTARTLRWSGGMCAWPLALRPRPQGAVVRAVSPPNVPRGAAMHLLPDEEYRPRNRCEVLGLPRVGVRDNFSDLGGTPWPRPGWSPGSATGSGSRMSPRGVHLPHGRGRPDQERGERGARGERQGADVRRQQMTAAGRGGDPTRSPPEVRCRVAGGWWPGASRRVPAPWWPAAGHASPGRQILRGWCARGS